MRFGKNFSKESLVEVICLSPQRLFGFLLNFSSNYNFLFSLQLWSHFHEPERVEYACQLSLNNLGLDYIDLFLIHWPFAFPYFSDSEFLPTDDNGNLVR